MESSESLEEASCEIMRVFFFEKNPEARFSFPKGFACACGKDCLIRNL